LRQRQSFDLTGMTKLPLGMSFELLINKWQTLNSSVEALAAIGAELRLRREELMGDSRVWKKILSRTISRKIVVMFEFPSAGRW
jgi:hypothetical protein